MDNGERRVFVFGWDAATWSIINRLLSEGRLPNLSRMIREGTSAILVAEEPIFSPSVWTTIASGKKKEKHGILDFNVSARHVRCKRMWDILQDKGYTTGIYGHFVTWPPQPVKGFIIPGILAATDDTYPPELSFLTKVFETDGEGIKRSIFHYAANALRGIKYGLRIVNLFQIVLFLFRRAIWLKEDLEISLRRVSLGLTFRFNFFMKLFKRYRPHYSFFHAHNIDGVSHRCWRYLEPEKFPGTPEKDIEKYGRAVFRAYELLDRLLGRFMKRFGEDITYVVISDHGIGPGEGKVMPVMYKVNIRHLLDLIGAHDEYRVIDRGFEVVYLRPKDPEKSRITEHSRVLADVKFEKNGKPLFEVNLECGSIFLIDRFDKNKVLDMTNETVLINAKRYPLKEIVYEHKLQTSGWHHPEGVFVIRGGGIKKGIDIGKIQQPDITPTLLHLYGLPAGKDMDGKVLVEVFDDEFIKYNPPEYIDTYEKPGEIKPRTDSTELTEKVERQLGDLGYFS